MGLPEYRKSPQITADHRKLPQITINHYISLDFVVIVDVLPTYHVGFVTSK